MLFREKLHDLRKKAGMTQADLAEKLNVSRQAVSRWEMGTAMPEIESLIAMSELFGVSLDFLLKEAETDPKENTQVKMSFWEQLKQMHPLELAATIVLCLVAVWFLWRMLESSRWVNILKPAILLGALFAGVMTAAKIGK